MLRYKGYECDYQYDEEDLIWYGKIEDIHDLVNFESETYDGLEEEFHKSVDDYLEFCKEVGKEPDKPKCCGTCDWYAEFEGVCCNGDSEYRADFRCLDDTCDCWTSRGKKLMASENKKRKAKNSYLHNGGDKSDYKLKRIMYYTKRQRNKLKRIDAED